MPEGLPPPKLLEEGVLLSYRTAHDMGLRLKFYRERYPGLCQMAIDDQAELDAITIRTLGAAFDESEQLRLEQEPLLPWWAWTLIGAGAGAMAATFAVVRE